MQVLRAAYGDGSALDVDDVSPYLGEIGARPIFELTNAIDGGDVPESLAMLHRMLTSAGGRQTRPMHPLQVMALLHNHYRRLLRLDDPEVRTEADALEALGGRVKAYPARKARDQAAALGTERLRRAFDYVAQADLDLRGATALSNESVLEVLVARLAGLSRQSRRGGRTRARQR